MHQKLTIEFKIAHIRPWLVVRIAMRTNVIEVVRMRKIAIKREDSGDFLGARLVNKFTKQNIVIFERFFCRFAGFTFAKTKKVNRIVVATRAHVVCNQKVMRNLMSLLCVVPIIMEFSLVL